MCAQHLRLPSSQDGWFAAAVRRARNIDPDFTYISPHDLRHTAASLAISARASVKAAQRMLGHASAAMTLDTYADLFDNDQDYVAQALSRARHPAHDHRAGESVLRTRRSPRTRGQPRSTHSLMPRPTDAVLIPLGGVYLNWPRTPGLLGRGVSAPTRSRMPAREITCISRRASGSGRAPPRQPRRRRQRYRFCSSRTRDGK
jgi:hypothetical protein